MIQESATVSDNIENLNLPNDDVLESSSYIQEDIEQCDVDEPDAHNSITEQIKLNFDHVKNIIYELGLIKLCWSNLDQPNFEDRDKFPLSYSTNSDKEKVLLLYAENFRLQFTNKYPNRKPLFLACENECGIQKMVCTTIRPTTLPYPELESWINCASFLDDHLKFEPFEDFPTLLPRRLCSPHTTILRQSGHSFEISTSLCSLLIGVGYDAYVVSGYAIKDVTFKIMSRINSPFPPATEIEESTVAKVTEEKYKLKPPKDLRSKFLLMMAQREIDKINYEKEILAEKERLRVLEEERRSPDELDGQRVHAWVIILAGKKDIQNHFFIEPSTGLSYELNSDFFCGIESIWNHQNYWVNMQDCSHGIGDLDFDLDNIKKWEHLLPGEPLVRRKIRKKELEEEETNEMYDEKHLDMPISWSIRISIPHDVLKRRFPDGSIKKFYKRTCVEQFAPYATYDGLVTKVTRYKDFACTEVKCLEEIYENRGDKQFRHVRDVENNVIMDYFNSGREDSVIKYVYHDDGTENSKKRTIYFKSDARFDALSKIECTATEMTQFFENREDRLYYRQVVYNTMGTTETISEGTRQTVKKIIEKFGRNETKNPNDDIAFREFSILERKIYLKYHYGKGNVTASTRTFIKPSISEMGEKMIFKPELTYGYQTEIGAKLPSNLKLFILFEEQLKEEDKVLDNSRETENQIRDFILLRAHEQAFCKLDISLYNKEQNLSFRNSMLDKQEQQRICKVKEVEEEINYLAPYLARIGNPTQLNFQEALDIKYVCLDDFKNMLLKRATNLQKNFENASEQLQTKKNWYALNHDNLSPEDEALYFAKVNTDMFYLHALEIRLTRHKELSPLRFEALMKYLENHPMLHILHTPAST